jgi:hypothetical protein
MTEALLMAGMWVVAEASGGEMGIWMGTSSEVRMMTAQAASLTTGVSMTNTTTTITSQTMWMTGMELMLAWVWVLETMSQWLLSC